MPLLAIGPKSSAGGRECPRKLLYPMLWPEGGKVVPSPSLWRRLVIGYEAECFLYRSHSSYSSLPANFVLCNFA